MSIYFGENVLVHVYYLLNAMYFHDIVQI